MLCLVILTFFLILTYSVFYLVSFIIYIYIIYNKVIYIHIFHVRMYWMYKNIFQNFVSLCTYNLQTFFWNFDIQICIFMYQWYILTYLFHCVYIVRINHFIVCIMYGKYYFLRYIWKILCLILSLVEEKYAFDFIMYKYIHKLLIFLFVCLYHCCIL